MYAFLVDGLEPEQRKKIDDALKTQGVSNASQAQRERDAIAMIASLPGAKG